MAVTSLYSSEPVKGSCLVSIPFSSEECPPKSKDEFIIVGSVGIAFTSLVASAAKKVGEAVASRLLSRALSRIWPPPLTPEERLIFETLYKMDSFKNGIELLMKEWPDVSPSDAVRYTFEFLYRRDPRHPMAEMCPSPYAITAGDVQAIMERHNITHMQVYNIARLVDERFGYDKSDLWNEIYRAIFDARYAAASEGERPQIPDRTITDTQRLFLEDMRRERMAQEREVIRDILYELAMSLSGEAEEASLDQFRITIDTTPLEKTFGRFALIKELEEIAERLDNCTQLSKAEEQFILKLEKDNPVIQKIIDARTNSADTAITGTNLAVRMTEQSLLGEYAWFRRILEELKGIESTTRAGIVVHNEEGGTERYGLVYNVPGLGRGNRVALYIEGEPYPAGPFSFQKGDSFDVTDGGIRVEGAVIITETPTRNFYITVSEMEHLQSLARVVMSDHTLRTSNVGRAFLRFFNRLQALFKAAYGEEFAIEAGSPQARIEQLARQLARENWAAEFEQKLEWVSGEFENMDARAARHESGKEGETIAFIETALAAEMNEIRAKYMEDFCTKFRPAVKAALKRLERAILDNNIPAKNSALAELRVLSARQTGARHMDELSLDLYGEWSAWRDVSAEEMQKYAHGGEPPDRLRYFIVARGVDRGMPPSLARARNYAHDRSFDMAIMEYDRVTAERDIPMSERIIAQAEKASLAVEHHQFQRARRAVMWIERARARGQTIPADAEATLEKLPPLNSGRMVVVPERKTAPAKTKSAIVEAVESGEGQSIDLRPRGIRLAEQGIRDTVDIGTPAAFGAAVFLGAAGVTREIFGPPETEMEALIQGYDTIGLAMTGEGGIRKGINYYTWRNIPAHARPIPSPAVPFNMGEFAGNLGIGIMVYRSIYFASDYASIDKMLGENVGPFNTNEVIGLAGTGALLGASQTILSRISPSVALDITRHRMVAEMVKETGGAIMYNSTWSPTVIRGLNTLKVGAAVTIAIDIADTIATADDRSEDRYVVGQCKEEIGLPVASFFLSSYYDLLCRAYGRIDAYGGDLSEYAGVVKKRYDLEENEEIMSGAASNIIKWFDYDVRLGFYKAPSTLEDVIRGSLIKSAGRLQQWEAFQYNYLHVERDRHWIFRTGAVKDGNAADIGAVAFWLEPYFTKVLDQADDDIGNSVTVMRIVGMDSEVMERRLALIQRYKEELKEMTLNHHAIRNDGIWPSQLAH